MPDGATEIERIEIAIDGVLNAGTGSELTINGNLDDNNGNVSFNNKGTFNQGNSTIIFSGTNAVISGIVDFYNITISVGAALSMIEGTKMRIENTFTNDGTFYSNMLGASTVEYFGDAQDIILPESNTYSSLILSGSGNKTLPASALSIAEDLQISGTANVIAQEEITIDNNFLIATNSTFNTGAFNHSIGGNMEVSGTLAANAANTIEFNGTQQQLIFGSGNPQFGILQINNLNGVLMGLDVETETELKLTNGDLFVGNNTLGINGIISGTTNIVVDNSSSISFGGTDAIVIPDNIFNTNPSINNLTIDRTGGVTLGNQTFTINGVLSLTSGSLVADGKTLSIAGAISSTTGTLSTNNSTSLNFAENENMLTIPNNIFTTQNLGTVYINRTGGITLGNQEINIDTKLILENGILYSNGNTINFTANAEVGTSLVNTTPGSDLSYIEGCVAKLGNTAFTFPIGDSRLHAPIGISAADGGGSVAGEFTACYYNEAYTNIEDLELGIDHVSSAEHWILNRSAESNNVAITLYWNQTRSGGIDNLEDLAVVRWSGTEWENHGNTATSEVGDWGTITSEIITSFSPITLASTSESNPLPIELEYIKSECLDYESNASVEWKTLSEKNNEKFILELSYNSKIWKEIGSVIGNGNSTISHTYTFSHNHSNIVEPELYYRLKQIDYDGKYSYSYIISQSNCNNTNGVKVFPNPFGNQISINMEILNSEFISISLTDVYGIEHIHYNEKIENGKYLKTFDTSFLTRGIYFIEIGLNHKTLTKKIIKY